MKKVILHQIFIIVVALTGMVLFCTMSIAQDSQPAGPPIFMQLNQSKIMLNHNAKVDNFNSEKSVSVKVGSTLPKWQIACIVEPLDKVDSEQFEDDVVSVSIKNRNIELSSSSPVPLLEGTKTGPQMIHGDDLKFSIKVDPFKPPKTYQYRVHFLMKGSGFSRFVNGPSLLLCYEQTQFVCVEVKNEGISFGQSLALGENQSNPAIISVITNRENLHLIFSLDELNLVKKDLIPPGVLVRGTIKGNMIALGGGFTLDAAVHDIHQKQYGQNQFGIECPSGQHTIYLYSKLKVDVGHRPGDYEGVIKVQYNNHNIVVSPFSVPGKEG